MKRMVGAAIAAAALCVGMLAGCAANDNTGGAQGPTSSEEKIQVVCATFPAYDWAHEVVGDEAERVELTYLMGNGTDLHSFQPSVEDVARIADADLFVYVGGESDEWAQDAVEAAANPSLRTVSMLAAIGDAAVEEEVVEGMEADEHEDEEEGEHEHEGEGGSEYDEHVWLSLKNAQTLVGAIADELAVDRYNLAIAVMIALVNVVGMNLVGALLFSALVVFPALSAMRMCRTFRAVTALAAGIGVACALLGMLASILLGTPVGSTIVMLDAAAFAASCLAERAIGRGSR